ncbi:uncharacterized protein G2W53_010527 [Senna tora]|uniref:Uncharacterized protein n=1 Tax=Senna tora TaxID=362788 RepID=A0A834X041_9FABA|nr:uncharacterized protein G2W53_010527 [Senna tora]
MAGDSKPSRYVKFHGSWRRRATRTLVKGDSSTKESIAENKVVPITSKNFINVEEDDMLSSYSPLTQSQPSANCIPLGRSRSAELQLYTFESLAKKYDVEIQELKEELGRLKSETKKNHEQTMKMLSEIYKSVV